MHTRAKRYAIALVGAAVLISSQLALPSAHANHGATYDIQVGDFYFEQGVPGLSIGFFPRAVTVHKGDTVHFVSEIGAPILLPANAHPEDYMQANASQVNDPFFDLVSDPDEGTDAYKFNPAFFFEPPTCGDSVDNPCAFNGNGDPLIGGDVPEFFVTITANPGDTIWAVLSNTGNSKFRIDVVEDTAASSTQAELDARADAQRDHDFNLAHATHNKMLAKQSKHTTPGGKTVWDAWAGIDRGAIILEAFYPKTLKVKKGDSVMWHFELQNNIHNATFNFNKAKEITNNTFVPVCDTDGDQAAAPDVDPIFSDQGPECAQGELEFDIHPDEMPQVGNGVFGSANDFEKSATSGYEHAAGGFFNDDPWTLKFKVGPGTYKYGCTIHGPGFMGGKIIVPLNLESHGSRGA